MIVKTWLLMAAALLPLAACGSPESQVDSALAEMERQEPVFALLREHEPDAYAEMRALVERAGRQGGKSDQTQLIQRSRGIFTKVIERRVMTAPDELVQRMVTFVADQTKALESNPPVCKNLLAGTAGDVRPFIPPEMQQRERDLYEDLLKSTSRQDGSVATQEQVQQRLAAILAEAQGALGLDEAGVANALDGSGPPLEVCRANGYLMQRLGQLPPAEGAPIFRFLTRMASQQRPPTPPLG
jgi:hypothetical protein